MENIDLDLDLDNIEANTEKKLKVKNRFEELSEKVILTSKERDELAKSKQDLEAKNADISKERDFYKDFSASVSKYPGATAFQEKILEKVKGGYATEDAVVSVLAREGKLTQAPVPGPDIQVEGGSAPTVFEGNKTIQDMTSAEKLAALTEADKTGDLISALRSR